MLLKSINYWSFPGGLEGKLDVFEAMSLAKQHGFEAIELAIFEAGPLGLDTSEAACQKIKAEAEKLDLHLPTTASGLYWERSLADGNEAARKQAREDLESMTRIAGWLGAKTHLTIPGAVEVFFMPDRPVQPYEEVYNYSVEGLNAVLPTAEKAQVRLGIENVWNKFLLSPIEMRDFIDGFRSPWIGAYLDVANILPYGYPEHWIRALGNRIAGVHFKDFRRAAGTIEGFVDLLEGDVNWPEVVRALNEIRYDGAVSAEMIPGYKHHSMVRIANTSRAMDAILGRSA
jgi:hexulose-6-phosphate isomerase